MEGVIHPPRRSRLLTERPRDFQSTSETCMRGVCAGGGEGGSEGVSFPASLLLASRSGDVRSAGWRAAFSSSRCILGLLFASRPVNLSACLLVLPVHLSAYLLLSRLCLSASLSTCPSLSRVWKVYKEHGYLWHFTLEEQMDYGPSIVAKFAHHERRVLEELGQRVSEQARKTQKRRKRRANVIVVLTLTHRHNLVRGHG